MFFSKPFLSSFLLLLSLSPFCHSSPSKPFRAPGHRLESGPSPTPIGTTNPNLPGGTIANDAPPGPFFTDFTPPFPTDAWWSGFTVGNQDAVVAGPFPFQTATTSTGLIFGISDTRRFDGTSIHVDTQRDFTIGFTGLPATIQNRKATAWDTQAVCLQYFNGGSTMDTCLVPGSPYMTFTFNNAEVLITSNQGDISDFTWVTPGTKAKVTHNGGTYLIYILSGNLQLNRQGTTQLQGQGAFTGTIRFAKLKEANQESVLDTHSSVVPSGVDMAYQVSGDVSTQTWTWTVSQGNAADLLLLSWPHHRRALENANFVDIQYLTLKGQMKGVRGNTWVQRHELPQISWFSLNAPHASCQQELRKTLKAEVDALEVMVPGDFYFWGGAFGRASRLALIAEHLGGDGSQEIIQKVVQVLKTSVEYWFDGNRSPSAAFETGWGGFINKDGWNNTWVDFGNAYYNDHHFHYGYILHGAAVIGKYDPAWLNQHLDFFMQIARNTGNPSPADPHYAVTRHFDFFAGHSWASGIANGAGPRDQESSGEAINGYYGLLLFAHSINNQPLIDWSRILIAMEIAGAREYWHLYPNSQDPEQPYPEPDFRALTTVGNVMDTQAGAWLFWGGQRIQIAAIQILPLTPIGHYTYDREWMEGVLPYCRAELEDTTLGDDFKSVIYAAYAAVNPSQAYGYSRDLFDWGSGNSASNQLYFVSTQQSTGGDICEAGLQTPEGLYNLQDYSTGQFLTISSDGHLAATTAADVLAEKFELGFRPGGGVIKATSSGKFVTASPEGTSALTAARDTAQGYETFRWTQPADGTYTLTAMVNRMMVTVNSGTGELFNNANATNGVTPARFRLVPTDDATPQPPPAQGALQSKQNNLFVVATQQDVELKANGNNVGGATRWTFERVPDSSDQAPMYYIKSTVTEQYVTGNMDGSTTLKAASGVAQAWEEFRFVGYQGGWIVIHRVSGNAVKLQPDGTLIDNGKEINNESVWNIV